MLQLQANSNGTFISLLRLGETAVVFPYSKFWHQGTTHAAGIPGPSEMEKCHRTNFDYNENSFKSSIGQDVGRKPAVTGLQFLLKTTTPSDMLY